MDIISKFLIDSSKEEIALLARKSQDYSGVSPIPVTESCQLIDDLGLGDLIRLDEMFCVFEAKANFLNVNTRDIILSEIIEKLSRIKSLTADKTKLSLKDPLITSESNIEPNFEPNFESIQDSIKDAMNFMRLYLLKTIIDDKLNLAFKNLKDEKTT